MCRIMSAIGLLFLAACGSDGGSVETSNATVTPTPVVANCAVTTLESELSAALDSTRSEVDFSFAVERADGRRFTYNRNASTLQTAYESASTSKLVSAVIILRLVEQGYLNLNDRPQDRISSWLMANTSPLYGMTLAHLLSFTSGLSTEPLCLNAPGFDFASCVNNIATSNFASTATPGSAFYYASTHLQVAGLMAVRARGVAGWQDVFAEFQAQTGLFSHSAYDLPSSSNPRLAGGMHWTGEDYLAFLKALKSGSLLSAASMTQLLTDRTVGVTMSYSPVYDALGEDWHYGFGFWHECAQASFNCTAGERISSPGAYGAYPFWDRGQNYFGIVARQGALGTFPNGVTIERAVRPQVEAWAACQ